MPTVTVLAWCLMASTGRVSSSIARVSAPVRSSITTLGEPATRTAFDAWLDAGLHGDMAYLAGDGAALRRDSRRPHAGATHAIVLATQYGGREPSGPVARYARGDDYHELLRERTRALHHWLEAELGRPVTTAELADAAGLQERWVREWAHNQAAARIVDVDTSSSPELFSLSPEAVAVLASPDHVAFGMGMFHRFPQTMGALEEMAPVTRLGYFMRNHAASIPP